MSESREEWRPVVDFPDYDVSNLGRIRTWKNNRHGRLPIPKVLNPKQDDYVRVVLRAPGVHKDAKVHILVAHAFIGPRPTGMEVCHWNGRPWDNRVENLRYDTPKANSGDDKRRHGSIKIGQDNHRAVLTDDQVREIRRMRRAGVSGRATAVHFHVSEALVSMIFTGKKWAHLLDEEVAA